LYRVVNSEGVGEASNEVAKRLNATGGVYDDLTVFGTRQPDVFLDGIGETGGVNDVTDVTKDVGENEGVLSGGSDGNQVTRDVKGVGTASSSKGSSGGCFPRADGCVDVLIASSTSSVLVDNIWKSQGAGNEKSGHKQKQAQARSR
jgi:hypothetical protein